MSTTPPGIAARKRGPEAASPRRAPVGRQADADREPVCFLDAKPQEHEHGTNVDANRNPNADADLAELLRRDHHDVDHVADTLLGKSTASTSSPSLLPWRSLASCSMICPSRTESTNHTRTCYPRRRSHAHTRCTLADGHAELLRHDVDANREPNAAAARGHDAKLGMPLSEEEAAATPSMPTVLNTRRTTTPRRRAATTLRSCWTVSCCTNDDHESDAC